jgi:hypothetical protein
VKSVVGWIGPASVNSDWALCALCDKIVLGGFGFNRLDFDSRSGLVVRIVVVTIEISHWLPSKPHTKDPGRPFTNARRLGAAGKQDPAAETLAAVEIAAGLRAVLVDGAELRHRVEGHAGAVPVLLHAAHAVMLDHKFRWHGIAGSEFDHQMAATAAAGAGWEIGMGRNGADEGRSGREWRTFVRAAFLSGHGVTGFGRRSAMCLAVWSATYRRLVAG